MIKGREDLGENTYSTPSKTKTCPRNNVRAGLDGEKRLPVLIFTTLAR